MVSFLFRPLLGMAAAFVLFSYTTSPIAAQIPKVDCQVGDTVVVEFRGGQSEAVVTEILGDGAMIKADVINADGSKENWPFGAMQVKSVNSSAKRDSASDKKSSDDASTSDNQDPEIRALDSEPDRTWTSADEKFTVSAKLAGKSGNMVRLIRTNGKATRIEFDKLCEEDRKYIEAALKKAQSEAASNPFSDSKTESKPVEPKKVAAEDTKPRRGIDETSGKKAITPSRPEEQPTAKSPEPDNIPTAAPANPPPPQPAQSGMPFLVMMFLRFGFSGFLFGPLLVSGIALLAVGLKNANRYY